MSKRPNGLPDDLSGWMALGRAGDDDDMSVEHPSCIGGTYRFTLLAIGIVSVPISVLVLQYCNMIVVLCGRQGNGDTALADRAYDLWSELPFRELLSG